MGWGIPDTYLANVTVKAGTGETQSIKEITPEDRANLKDPLLVCHDGHLFVQLG